MSQASSTQVRYTVKKNWEVYGNKTNKQYRELCLPELYCKKNMVPTFYVLETELKFTDKKLYL